MTPAQFAALQKWIRAECRCAASYERALAESDTLDTLDMPKWYARLQEKRTAAAEAFWMEMRS